jgi:hypothetical protein
LHVLHFLSSSFGVRESLRPRLVIPGAPRCFACPSLPFLHFLLHFLHFTSFTSSVALHVLHFALVWLSRLSRSGLASGQAPLAVSKSGCLASAHFDTMWCSAAFCGCLAQRLLWMSGSASSGVLWMSGSAVAWLSRLSSVSELQQRLIDMAVVTRHPRTHPSTQRQSRPLADSW